MVAPVFVTDDVPSATQVNDWFVNINFVVKPSDESVTSSTTLQADNDLMLPVEASSIYILDMVFTCDGATAADIKWEITAPSGATMQAVTIGPNLSATDTTNPRCDPINIGSVPNHGTLGSGVYSAIVTRGIITTSSTAGDVGLEWAQLSSSGTATHVKAGSYMSLKKVS